MARIGIEAALASHHQNIARIEEAKGLPIEVLQSIQALAQARREYLRTVIDYNIAQFTLYRALGWPCKTPPELGDQNRGLTATFRQVELENAAARSVICHWAKLMLKPLADSYNAPNSLAWGDAIHEFPAIFEALKERCLNSASISIMWPRSARPGERTSPIRSGRPRWPSSAAPTASRSTCAKIAGIFRIAICAMLRETVTVKLNLELAANDDVIEIACQTRPDQATLVPERREEVTTEGGLGLLGSSAKVGRGAAPPAGCGHQSQPVSGSRSGGDRNRRRAEGRRRRIAHRAICPGRRRASRKPPSWPGWSSRRQADRRGRHGPARRPRPDLSQRAADRRDRRTCTS